MRHWHAHGLKPHLVRAFKVSRDPKFVEKLEDIVGARDILQKVIRANCRLSSKQNGTLH
jgi:hypothetical protein